MRRKRLLILTTLAVLMVWGNLLIGISMDSRIHADLSRLWSTLLKVNSPAGYDVRFAELREALPKRGTVGYLCVLPNEHIFDDVGESGAYYQTQYALAPVVVDNSWSHELVVGNFGDVETAKKKVKNFAGVKRVHDFGNGLVLITREKSDE